VQPFKGVSWSARLRELSNLDKHRQAIVVQPAITWLCPHDISGARSLPLSTTATVNLTAVGDDTRRLQDEAKGMAIGMVEFLNPFLAAEGHQPMSLAFNY
jgi:hypothetical protein